MLDLARLRQNQIENGEDDEQLFVEFPSRLYFELQAQRNGGTSRHANELAIARDPYARLRRPLLIFNRACGPLDRIGDIPEIDDLPKTEVAGLAERWDVAGLTEFEVDSRCIPFDAHAWDVFRRGGQVLWVWDPDQKLPDSGQEDSLLIERMKTGLAARMLIAELMIGKVRSKLEPERKGGSTHNSDKFVEGYYKHVIEEKPDANGKYKTPMEQYEGRHDKFRKFYGLSSKQAGKSIPSEADLYGYFYDGSDRWAEIPRLEQVEKREFAILKALRGGLLRAEAIQRANADIRRNAAQHLGGSDPHKQLKEHHEQLIRGSTDHYDLSLIDYFAIALYCGFNPLFLRPDLIHISYYLDVAVWIGRLGRADRLTLLPELCEAFQDVLLERVPDSLLNNDLDFIFRWLRQSAEYMTDISQLTEAINDALTDGKSVEIEREVFGHIVRRKRKGTTSRLPDGVTLLTFSSIGVKYRPADSEPGSTKKPLLLKAWLPADDSQSNGDELTIRPFIPWAW